MTPTAREWLLLGAVLASQSCGGVCSLPSPNPDLLAMHRRQGSWVLLRNRSASVHVPPVRGGEGQDHPSERGESSEPWGDVESQTLERLRQSNIAPSMKVFELVDLDRSRKLTMEEVVAAEGVLAARHQRLKMEKLVETQFVFKDDLATASAVSVCERARIEKWVTGRQIRCLPA